MRVLFVGLGGAGQRHLRNVRAILGRGAECHAYRHLRRRFEIDAALRADRAVDVERKYGLTVHSTLAAALKSKPHVTIISNPTALHVPAALAAARAGSHLFIEKPLSHNMSGVNGLADEVRRRGLVAAMGFQMRFHPALLRIRRMITGGLIGRVLAARIDVRSFMPDWHPYEPYRKLYAARVDLGGGVLTTECHELDYAAWLFGEPLSVHASGGRLGEFPMDVEDTVSMSVDFDFRGNAVPLHIQLSFVQRPPRRTVEISGTAGVLFWNVLSNELELTGRNGRRRVLMSGAYDRNRLFADEMLDFFRAVRAGGVPRAGIDAGIRNLKIIEAARESMRSGSPVRVG